MDKNNTKDMVWLLPILSVAFLLRMYHLDSYSLWDDEAKSFIAYAGTT